MNYAILILFALAVAFGLLGYGWVGYEPSDFHKFLFFLFAGLFLCSLVYAALRARHRGEDEDAQPNPRGLPTDET